MSFEVLKKEYVIQTLAKGTRVIMCDFDTMRMSECDVMTVAAISAFIAKPNTVFYKEVEAASE